MAQITDLNVSPYYDDFDKNDNFQKVLFRPGFAVQARELTTLQSILQDQISSQGRFIFKEGSQVIPGQASFSRSYFSLQLASTFGGEDIILNQFFNETSPVTITGSTSGVKAQVIGFKEGTSTTQPILYYQYTAAGTDTQQWSFLIQKTLLLIQLSHIQLLTHLVLLVQPHILQMHHKLVVLLLLKLVYILFVGSLLEIPNKL